MSTNYEIYKVQKYIKFSSWYIHQNLKSFEINNSLFFLGKLKTNSYFSSHIFKSILIKKKNNLRFQVSQTSFTLKTDSSKIRTSQIIIQYENILYFK